MERRPAVYIMANKPHGTLYVGVTSDLIRRATEHRQGLIEGFSKRYACKRLVYYELFEDMNSAISREKQLKAGKRKTKVELIEDMNFEWHDLYGGVAG